MTAWLEWFSNEGWSNLALALGHTLWQGGLIALLLYGVLKAAPAGRVNLRYGASVAGLGAVVLAGVVTWGVLGYEPRAEPVVDAGTASAPPVETEVVAIADGEPSSTIARDAQGAARTQAAPTAAAVSEEPFDWKPVVSAVWLIGVAVMLGRAGLMVLGAGRLRRRCRLLADDDLAAEVDRLRDVMGVARRVRLAVGEHLHVPAVAGLFWPTILVPTSMMSGVPLDQLRAVLAHELAHIRRHDYLVNLLQLLVEAVLFFNPAAWWISRQIRIEREACCDAAAATAIGGRTGYARLLADWAEATQRKSYGAVAALAFDGNETRMPLLDRVRRLVTTDHRPPLRVTWYTLSAFILGGAVLLGALRFGSEVAVEAAAKVLSPGERLEQLEELEATYGRTRGREYTDADDIRVSGMIRRHDGEPIPDIDWVHAITRRPGMTSGHSFNVDGDRFSGKAAFGTLYIALDADGYAPAFAGPLKSEPGGEVKDIELVLGPGFEGGIRVEDESGKPIPGAQLSGYYDFAARADKVALRTDEAGMATIRHCADKPLKLEARAAGYQVEEATLALSPDKPTVWKLEPAVPATGVIVSRETGKPVSGAELRLLVDEGPGGQWHSPDSAEVLAVTDEHGRFTLDSLRDDTAYHFYIAHPDHRRQLLKYVKAGAKLEIELGPPLYVRGRIIGPLEELPSRRGNPTITYSNPYKIEDHGYSDLNTLPVEVDDGVGRFEIRDIWQGVVRISAGENRLRVDVEDEPIDDLVIDVTPGVLADGKKEETRTVILRFDLPEESPPPSGTLRVHTIAMSKFVNGRWIESSTPHDLEVDGREVGVELPVPGRVSYDVGSLVGYWVDDMSGIEVPPGDEPFVVDVPVVSAGAIYGQVLTVDGEPAVESHVTVVVVEKAPEMENKILNLHGADLDPTSARFMISPLPIGGKYRVVARKGHATYTISPILEVTGSQPTQETRLKFVDGITVSGQVLMPDGTPASGVAMKLSYGTPYSHGFSPADRFTGPDGRFRIEHVNPDMPGHYDVEIRDAPGCRPLVQELGKLSGPREEITIRLKKGYVVTGVLLDEESGLPVVGGEVYALPADHSEPEPFGYQDAEAETNEKGEFRFDNLGRREYNFYTRVGRCKAHPGVGGQDEPVIVRVKIPEDSRYKPRPHNEGERGRVGEGE